MIPGVTVSTVVPSHVPRKLTPSWLAPAGPNQLTPSSSITCTGIAAGTSGARFVHCAVKRDVLAFQQEESPNTIRGGVVPQPVGAVVQVALLIAPDELLEAVPLPTTPLPPAQVPPGALNAHISRKLDDYAGYPPPPAVMEGVPQVPPVSAQVAAAPSPPVAFTVGMGAEARPKPL